MTRKRLTRRLESTKTADLEKCDMQLSERSYKLTFLMSQSFRGIMYREGTERIAPDFIERAYRGRVNLLRFEPINN